MNAKFLEKETHKLAQAKMYSYRTIVSFGWASHLDSSRGGLVIEMKNRENICVNMNKQETSLVLDENYDLSNQERIDIEHLINWIAEPCE